MSRKILAALTALTICAGLAACGNNKEKDKSKADTASSAAAESKADSSDATSDAEDKDDTADDVTTDAESPEDIDPFENMVAEQINDNIVLVTDKSVTDKPSEEELKALCALGEKHYNTACSGDMQAYLDTFAFDILVDPVTDFVDSFNYMTEEEVNEWLTDPGNYAQFQAVDNVINLVSSLGSTEANSKLDDAFAKGDDNMELRPMIAELLESINADEPNTKDALATMTLWESVAAEAALPEADGRSYLVFADSFANYDGVDFYSFDLYIYDADYEYDLYNAFAWKSGDKYGMGTMSGTKLERVEEEKGKSAAEIAEANFKS